MVKIGVKGSDFSAGRKFSYADFPKFIDEYKKGLRKKYINSKIKFE